MSSPTGTVTLLFTDVEGSSARWERCGEAMAGAIRRQEQIVEEAVAQAGGVLFKKSGDGTSSAFERADQALMAAVTLQRAVAQQDFSAVGSLRLRVGIHTGVTEERDGDYFGAAVNRAARLTEAGHGGQVLLSQGAWELVRDNLPVGVSARDLGDHRLRDLGRPERVHEVVIAGLQAVHPPLRTLERISNNLPPQVTSFIGREREMRQIRELLSQHRLITLTGPGGTGKTRLAMQVAASALEQFPDGVWLVELAPLTDAALVDSEVATALGIHETPGVLLQDTIADWVKRRRLLLVLDNCEHVVGACARIVNHVLRVGGEVKVLATSQEVLNVPGETVAPVTPLQLPEQPTLEAVTQSEAARLFVERATSMGGSFAADEVNAPWIVEICRRLDGIPLAIELAAARTKALSCEQIARRLGDRFRLLTGGSRTAMPRHQTLRAAIDWSYALLPPGEKTALHRLSVFAGGWTLEAAETVIAGSGIDSSDVLELITNLLDRSLIRASDIHDGDARYGMMETIRQYAQQKLGESGELEAVRQAHLAWITALATEARAHLIREDQAVWLARLEREHDNIRSALDWAVEVPGLAEAGLRLAICVGRLWHWKGYSREGHQRLTALLALIPADSDPFLRARALTFASYELIRLRELDGARPLAIQAAEILRAAGISRGLPQALAQQALCTRDPVEAIPLFEQALALAETLAPTEGLAPTTGNFGSYCVEHGDFVRAAKLLERSVEAHRAIGDVGGISWAKGELAELAIRQGNFTEAAQLVAESLAIERTMSRWSIVASGLRRMGIIAARGGNDEHAVALLTASGILQQSMGVPISDDTVDLLSQLRQRTDAALFERAKRRGETTRRQDLVDLAIGTSPRG